MLYLKSGLPLSYTARSAYQRFFDGNHVKFNKWSKTTGDCSSKCCIIDDMFQSLCTVGVCRSFCFRRVFELKANQGAPRVELGTS